MNRYLILLAISGLVLSSAVTVSASPQADPIGVLFSVKGNNGLPVERAVITMVDVNGTVLQLQTDGWGNATETLNAAIANPYDVYVMKRAWNLTLRRWITDTTAYRTALSADSLAADGRQVLSADLARTPGSDPKRISVLFVHYSNGDIALEGTCWNSAYNRNILNYMDTLTVVAARDTGDIAFRSYQMNADGGNFSGAALSAARPGSDENGCGFARFSNSSYGWGGDYNRMSIWCHQDDGPNNSEYDFAGLLDRFFLRPHKEDSAFWAPFRTTRLPDDTLEIDGFDLVCIKQPQRSYGRMNRARLDSLKVLYSIVYDSMAAHTEINWCLVFGFPNAYNAYKQDTASAALVGQLLAWFNDSLPDPDVHNVWIFDTYSLVDNDAHLMDRYYANPDDGDHLHPTTGATAVQKALIPKLRGIAEEILASRRTTQAVIPVDPPVADFAGAPASGIAPLSVTFTDLSTNTPTSWNWSWGDGTPNATVRNPIHVYTAVGTYTVSLTASNAGGSDSETKTGYITVSAPSGIAPVANFFGGPTTLDSGGTISFYDQTSNNPTAWRWNFGDNTAAAFTQNPVHQYNEVGTFSVTLTATNEFGSDDTVRTNYITVLSNSTGEETYAVFGGGSLDAEDTYISKFQPSTNYSTSTSHLVYNRNIGEVRVLVRWRQIDPIIVGASIDSAKLWLYPSTVERGPDTLLAIHRILRNWDPARATWNSAAAGTAWNVAGLGVGTDYLAAATDTAGGVVNRMLFWFDVTGDLQEWARGSQVNNGWMIKGAGYSYTQHVLFSANQIWNPTLRPKLEIWYHGAAGRQFVSEKLASLLLRGDLNGTSEVDISDLPLLIGVLFRSESASWPGQLADVDCDGNLSVSDLTYLIRFLFQGGAAPCVD